MLTKIEDAFIAHQFQVVPHLHMPGDPGAACLDVVVVMVERGKAYFLDNHKATHTHEDGACVTERYDANEMLARVVARGEVDLTHWMEG